MSCCGSLFVNLGGGGGGTVNTGVLQIAGGVVLDTTLRTVTDQAGNASSLLLSTSRTGILAGEKIGAGLGWGTPTAGSFNTIDIYNSGTGYTDFYSNDYGQRFYYQSLLKGEFNATGLNINNGTQSGTLTVKGGGANIASFRDSGNVEVASLDNNGIFISSANRVASGGFYGISGRFYFDSPGDSIITLYNNAGNSFNRQNFGGTTTSYPAIAASNTPAALAAKDATGANLIPFSAEDFTSGNLSTGTLITARPMQFGDKGTITTGNDLGLDAQIAVEHNGAVYYIPCSTFLIT